MHIEEVVLDGLAEGTYYLEAAAVDPGYLAEYYDDVPALESNRGLATGVDVIIDDTPDTVVVSCFDPVRRETARLALEKLVSDGRIHPGRIEEVVAKARLEVEVAIVETGEQAAYEVGVAGLHPELIKLIGRMKWRTSYGQNILAHSKEVAWLAGMMAAELGLDVALAKRGALLHDIGKVLTHEHEGTHVQLGVEVATKYGENPLVVNCIAAHHDDVPHESEVSVLVQAGDSISGSRPGARREAFETYVKRLEGLEKIASSYRGVERVFAIQAGREIRVVVTPEQVDDTRMTALSEEIARRIESELQYPGQIKVTIIRETRAGGTVVNDFYLHYIHPELPFGGVNNSGIGKSHGIWGFREFSNARSVYRRGRFAPTMLLTPPYKGWVKKVVGWLVS